MGRIGFLALLLVGCGSAPVRPATAGYRMHEWGVFIAADVRTHNLLREEAMIADKPILYFYGDAPFTIDAQVSFASGEPREVWPAIPLSSPLHWSFRAESGACTITPYSCSMSADDEAITDGIFLTSGPQCEAAELSLYETPDALCLHHRDATSRLLFYAGTLGAPPSDVVIRQDLEGNCQASIEIQNRSPHPIHDVFLLFFDIEASPASDQPVPVDEVDGRFGAARAIEVIAFDRIASGETASHCGGHHASHDVANELERTRIDFHRRLESRGLTSAESAALGRAWDETFFGAETGARRFGRPVGPAVSLVYTIDEAAYEAALPLTLEPAPAERVRVGVAYVPALGEH